MDSKVAIIIAIVAVIAIGGTVAAVIIANGNSNNNEDTTHVLYYHDEGHLAMKTTDTTVKGQDILTQPECFLIWNTKADCSGVSYNPGDEVKLGTKLYAIWGTHYMIIGNIMSSVDTLGLGLNISDDISEHRAIDSIIGLSEKGEATFAMSGWYTVEKFYESFRGKTHEGGNYIEVDPEADGATSIKLWVEGTTAYFKIKYDNTRNLTISASWEP